ncbi:MAG: adenylate/guanylate cyclase domain-containing protein [Candidatus Ozemobacteraceae bacterium]
MTDSRSQNESVLVIKPRPPAAWALLLFWVIVFFVPTVAFDRGILLLNGMTEKRAADKARREILHETSAFFRDLDSSVYFETVLRNTAQKVGLARSVDPVSAGPRFREEIVRRLGTTPTILFVTGQNFEGAWLSCDPRRVSPGGEPSKRILQAWLRRITQGGRSVSTSGTGSGTGSGMESPVKGGFSGAQIERLAKGIIGSDIYPDIISGRSSRVYSYKFGSGPLHIFVQIFSDGKGLPTSIHGAFMAMIPDRDLDPRKIAGFAIGASGKGMARSLRTIPTRALYKFRPFRKTRNTLSLVSAAPARFVLHAEMQAHKRRLALCVETLPGSLQSPWAEVLGIVSFLSHLLCMAGAMGVLRLGLMTAAPTFSLKTRMFVSLVAAVGIPLIVFLLAALAWGSAAHRMETLSSLDRMRRWFELVEAGLSARGVNGERAVRLARDPLCSAIGRAGNNTSSLEKEAFPIFRKLQEEDALALAMVMLSDGTIVSFPRDSERSGDAGLVQATRFFRLFMATILHRVGFMQDSVWEKCSTDRRQGTTDALLYTRVMEDSSINQLVHDEGRSWQMDFPDGTRFRFRVLLLSGKMSNGALQQGLVVILYDPKAVARAYFERLSRTSSAFREFEGEYEMRFGIFATPEGKMQPAERGEAWPSTAARDHSLTKLVREAREQNWTGANEDPDGKLRAVRFFQENSFLGVGVATPRQLLSRRKADMALGAVLVAYVLLLLRFASVVLGNVFTTPLAFLIAGIRRIRDGEFGLEFRLQTGDELALAADECSRMSRALLERERMRRFVSAFAEKDSEQGGAGRDIGTRVELSILFSHIRGFTELAERHSPEEIVELLNAYFTLMERAVSLHGGVIDKFIGDAVMAVFHPEQAGGEHPLAACRTAIAMRAAVEEFAEERRRSGKFPIETGIGIAVGTVIAGRVGSAIGRVDATVIGEAVNLAARLESSSERAHRMGILVCPEIARRVQFDANGMPRPYSAAIGNVRSLGRIVLKGIEQPIEVFELYSPGKIS